MAIQQSQSYLLQTILMDIKNEKKRNLLLMTMDMLLQQVNYTSNKELVKQKYTLIKILT